MPGSVNDSVSEADGLYEAALRCCGKPTGNKYQGGLKQQVFISHTGQDAGAKTFAASILRPALERAGVKVYMDFTSIECGESWKHVLVDAAANSQVVVAVLSESYTTRFWCMLELDLALRGHTGAGQGPFVIPVLYDEWEAVASGPGEVEANGERFKWQGMAAEWLGEKLLQKLEDEQLGANWRACVDVPRWVGNVQVLKDAQHPRRSAFHGKDAESAMADKVVAAALEHIVRDLHVGDVVGLEARAAELLAQLAPANYMSFQNTPQLDLWAHMPLGLWLHGFGGMGKTTLALYMYQLLSGPSAGLLFGLFSCRAVVEIKGDAGDNKSQLMDALKTLGDTNLEGLSERELVSRLASCVQDKKVLYVLDNVESERHLDSLLPIRWGAGSVVIVTSRCKAFPRSAAWGKVSGRLLPHDMQGLDMKFALALFRKFSGMDRPPAGLEQLEATIVQGCNGVPLALKIAGANLHQLEPSKQEWEDARDCLIEDDEVKGLLQHFWGRLDIKQRNMFLDVATVLRHQLYDDAKAAWIGWHGRRASLLFRDLERRCLVQVESGRLEMHDLLVELGRAKVLDRKDDHCGSRLWVKDGKVVGCNEAVAKKVLCAQLDVDDALSGQVMDDRVALPTMTHVALDFSQARILLLGRRATYVGATTALWVQMREGFAISEWVDKAEGMVLLQAWLTWYSGLTSLPESLGQLDALQRLNLERCSGLTSLPESLGQLCTLQSLNLRGCSRLASLPQSLGQLGALQSLDLEGCSGLASLPESLGQLGALQDLNLRLCSGLASLPESLGQLGMLQRLNLKWCSRLASLPESLGQLSVLQRLNFDRCSRLAFLPQSLGMLGALQSLNLRECSRLVLLPHCLGQLGAMQSLDLAGCSGLILLPQLLGQLAALQSLTLRGCSGLASLPASLGQLGALQNLDLRLCSGLASMPESLGQLEMLQRLNLMGCTALASLPESLGQLEMLQNLNLRGCSSLASLPQSLGQLGALRSLELDGCSGLASLPPSLGQLGAMQSLDLAGCSKLVLLPQSLGQLGALQSLDLRGCSLLASLPESLGQLGVLQSLDLEGCSALASLPESLGQLGALQNLNLRLCSALASLPESMGQLGTLQTLNLRWCIWLASLPQSLGQLGALQTLNLGVCKGLTSLPESLGHLGALQSLNLERCRGLVLLPQSLGQLGALQSLNIRECSKLASLPQFLGQLGALQDLNLEGCSALVSLPESLGQLGMLQSLNLKGCSGLVLLPRSLGQLGVLQSLNLKRCSGLASLPESLGQLGVLQSLDLEGCSGLASLPESLGQLGALQSLNLEWCSGLESVPESLGLLRALQSLNLNGCSRLPSLPQSLGQLQSLDIRGPVLRGSQGNH